MKKDIRSTLTRREREIMDILYRRESAHVGEVRQDLSGDTSYSAVRAQLRVLEEKGHVRHEERDLRYVYLPTVAPHTVRKSAIQHLVHTFFEGSTGKMMAALIGDESSRFSDEELKHLAKLIDKARKAGR